MLKMKGPSNQWHRSEIYGHDFNCDIDGGSNGPNATDQEQP